MKYESRLSRCTSVDLRYCSPGLNYGYVAFFERGHNLAYWIYRRVHLFENLSVSLSRLSNYWRFLSALFRFWTRCENLRNVTFIFFYFVPLIWMIFEYRAAVFGSLLKCFYGYKSIRNWIWNKIKAKSVIKFIYSIFDSTNTNNICSVAFICFYLLK